MLDAGVVRDEDRGVARAPLDRAGAELPGGEVVLVVLGGAAGHRHRVEPAVAAVALPGAPVEPDPPLYATGPEAVLLEDQRRGLVAPVAGGRGEVRLARDRRDRGGRRLTEPRGRRARLGGGGPGRAVPRRGAVPR